MEPTGVANRSHQNGSQRSLLPRTLQGLFLTKRRTALLLFTAALVALGIMNMIGRNRFFLVIDGGGWEQAGGALVLERLDPSGGLAQAGARKGDELVAVERTPISGRLELEYVLYVLQPKETMRYTVRRAGESFDLTVPLRRTKSDIQIYYFLCGVGFTFLGIGLVVLARKPTEDISILFYLLCLTFFSHYTFTKSVNPLDRLAYVYATLDTLALAVLPAVFLQFCASFPRPKLWSERSARLRAANYLVPLALAVLALLAMFVPLHWVPSSWGAAGLVLMRALETLDRAQLFYFMIGLVGGLLMLMRSYRRAPSIIERKQLTWIISGVALGYAPFYAFYVLPYALGWPPPAWTGLMVLPMGLIPLSFLYAIVKYKLMDVEIFLKRGAVYTLATTVGLLAYLGSFFLLSKIHSGDPLMLAAIATILVALLFEPLRSRIQVSLDKMFYRDRYSFRRTMIEFSHELNVESDLGALVDKVLTQVRETLNLAEVALFTPQGDGGRLAMLKSTHPAYGVGSALSAALSRMLLERAQQRDALVYEDPQALLDSYAADEPLLRALDIRCFIPFKVKEQTIALLALGRKRSGDFVNSEDLELLQTLANHAAMAMENARLYQNLRGQMQTVERLKEYNVNIVESIDVGVLVLDLDNQITGWNRSLEQITQVPRSAALGRPLEALFETDFVNDVAGLTRRSRFEPKEIFHLYRHRMCTKGGTELTANLSIAPLIGQEQETYGTVVILEDISERLKLEDQLMQSEKLASIGMLAAGVAHEVNTPLTGISSYAQMLKQKYPPEHPDRKLLERIENQTFRASRIVNALLNLAHQKQPELAVIDLHLVLNETLALLEHELKRGKIRVLRELDPKLPQVLGDSNKLQQVFLNLVLNSRDAMPDGGSVTLRTRLDGERVVVEVADTGVGIPPEALPKIYDPFFTTKRVGQGTGLGLALSYGIVQEHNGSIEVASEVGRGTTMTLSFPAAPARRSARRPAKVGAGGGREQTTPAALSAKPMSES